MKSIDFFLPKIRILWTKKLQFQCFLPIYQFWYLVIHFGTCWWLFAQNRPISDPFEFTKNLYQQSRKQMEIHLQEHRRRFRKFGAISRSYQNPPCSLPWAIAQAFCSKTANFRPWRIQPKSTQTAAKGVRNRFRRVWETFQGVWSDFLDLPKSAMFRTMGYNPGFLLKNGQFSTLANSPEIDTNSREKS